MPNRTAVVHLHIGRNKAGSTTLQDYFASHRVELEAAGVRYALFGHMKDSIPGVLGFGHQDELAAFARQHPDRAILVSNEFMFPWPRVYTENMVRGLKGLDVRVIAYIRPYGSWVWSNYAQNVRDGINRRNFDEFVEWFAPHISALPHLEPWGEGLGWNKVRVRSVGGRGIQWDDLVGDCLSAIGIQASPKTSLRSNQAPHWAFVEFLRSLIEHDQEDGWDEASVLVPIRDLFEQCLAEAPPLDRDVQYLTSAQARELARLYNRDIARLAELTGTMLSPEPVDGLPERPFLPTVDRIPGDLVQDFLARARLPKFAERYTQAAAALLRPMARQIRS
jgi:hypothetical protein